MILCALSLCGMAAVVTWLHRAEREALDPRLALEAVSRQIRAVHEDDFLRAYNHSASSVQVTLSAREFERMARKSYAPLRHSVRVELGEIKTVGNRASVRVFCVDREEAVTACLFALVAEQGQWRIDGMEILGRWPRGSHMAGDRL